MDKLRSIDLFVKVADKKSIAAAAYALDVTPSGVSKAISALETTLGFPLFHRSTRRISLTVDGELYLERCRRILQEIDDAESEVRHQRRTPSGTIKIAMHPAFRNPFCGGLGEFLTRHPNIKLETKFANSTSVLFDEGFDVLIRIGELADSNLVARQIGWVELILAASPTYLAQFGEPKTPADLSKHRWVFPARNDNVRGHSPRMEFIRGDIRDAVTVSAYVTALDMNGVPESVIGGAGIACLSSVALMWAIRAGLVKHVLPDWRVDSKPVHAVYPNARAITPRTDAIVKVISELVAKAGEAFPCSFPHATRIDTRLPRPTANRGNGQGRISS